MSLEFYKKSTLLIVLAILVVAAIKNPSSAETRALINDVIVEKINEKMEAEMMKEDNDEITRIAAFLGKAFASPVLDYFTNINVSDYIIFSTFDCSSNDENSETKNIVSGIVIFGKVIPLKSDLDKYTQKF